MAPGEKQTVVIEFLAETSKFGAGPRAAIEEVMKGMNNLGVSAEKTAGSLQKVANPNLMDPSNVQIRMADQLMKQYGMTVEEAARKAAEYWGGNKKVQQEATEEILRNIAATDALGKTTQDAAAKAVAGMKGATTATKGWGAALKVVKGLLGAIGIASLFGMLKSFINLLKEATEQAAEFSLNTYRLEVGVRAAQREFGMAAGSIAEWTGFVQDLRKQFQIFSLSDLTAATAKVILLTRELGFTKDQMQEVTKASIILAEVSGRDVEDAARRLALFLDTGYARGLAQLGVQVSKASVEQYALSKGINKTWNEMTRAERATIGLNAVLEQTSRLAGDAGLASETLKGQFQVLKAAQSDAMIEIGKQSGFLFLAWERVKTYFITSVVPAISKGLEFMAKKVIAGIASIVFWLSRALIFMGQYRKQWWDIFMGRKGIIDVMRESLAAAGDIAKGFASQMTKSLWPGGDLGDVAKEQLGSLESSVLRLGETTEASQEDWDSWLASVQDALTGAEEAAADMALDMARDFEDLGTELDRNLEDAFTGLMRDLEDLERDANQKRAEVIADAAKQEQELTAENTDKRAEMLAEYRLKQLQSQREFNLEMAQLEREYLFSLEDAIRERDARGVLMLMRKHNIDVAERNEDFAEKQRQAAENLALELSQIRQAEARKRKELRASLKQQLADIQNDLYLKSQEKYRDYLREREDIALRNRRDRDDLVLEYKRREIDLETHLNNRLTIMAKKFAEEHGLTVAYVKSQIALLTTLAGVYAQPLIAGMLSGAVASPAPSGFYGQSFGPSTSTRTRQATTVPTVSNQPGSRPRSTQQPVMVPVDPAVVRHQQLLQGGYAEGGMAIARKATPAIFGEAGPEAATFIPLNRLKEMGGVFGGGSRDRIALDISVDVSPDLVVSIIDKTMSEVAEVITRVGR